jgi:hypothetical protein
LISPPNQGGIRNVTIRSEDPSGSGNVGLDMAHADEIGPLLVQHAWARQLNIEGNTDEDPLHESKVMNNGGKLWILGMKTEDSGTVIKTIGGGTTELLGHLHVGATGNSPCFVTIESSFSAASTSATAFPVAALETRNGLTRSAPNLNHADLYSAFAEVSE